MPLRAGGTPHRSHDTSASHAANRKSERLERRELLYTVVRDAMTRAGVDMGLSEQQAHQLAVGTFVGASELARRSDEPPAVLRQRVTSKGGTTYAALQSMEAAGVAASFEAAMRAAEHRAHELGNEFGA